MLDTGLNLPNPLATLLAVPPPPSETGDKVQEAVEQAVKESKEQGIDKRGKEATPWLLKRVGELTGGSALNLSTFFLSTSTRLNKWDELTFVQISS
jgi:pseudouridine-5'-phosphate glycosidase/pseudouridine kinase